MKNIAVVLFLFHFFLEAGILNFVVAKVTGNQLLSVLQFVRWRVIIFGLVYTLSLQVNIYPIRFILPLSIFHYNRTEM